MELHIRLKLLLKLKHIYQKEFANGIGASECSVSKYCNGKRTPRLAELLKMSRYLKVSLDELTGNSPTFDELLEMYARQINFIEKTYLDL